jgi:hypothetical protein
MAQPTPETGIKRWSQKKDMVFKFGLTVQNTKENGTTAKPTEEDDLS